MQAIADVLFGLPLGCLPGRLKMKKKNETAPSLPNHNPPAAPGKWEKFRYIINMNLINLCPQSL